MAIQLSSAPDLVSHARLSARRSDIGSTACWYFGDGAERILLVHGFRGDHHGLEAIAGAISGFQVVVPDLPGYGKTPALSDVHSLTNYANWLAELTTEVKPTLVAGHSFGSLVVAAASSQLNTKKLALINPVATVAAEQRDFANRVARGFYRVAGTRLGRPLLRSSIAVQAMSSSLATSSDRALRGWIHQQHHRYFSSFASDAVALEGFEAATRNSIADYRLRLPTLMIAAERDQISSVADIKLIAANLDDAQVEVLPSVGHLLHYEQPAQVAALIEQFARG